MWWWYVGRKSGRRYNVNTNGVCLGVRKATESVWASHSPPGFCLSLGAAVDPWGCLLPAQLTVSRSASYRQFIIGTVGRDRSGFFFNGFNFTLSVPRWVSFNFSVLPILSHRLRVSEGWKPGSRGRVYILFMWLNLFWFLSCKMWILPIFVRTVTFCY